MSHPIPPEHLSTLAYLWQQYAAQPRPLDLRAQSLEQWQAWRDTLLSYPERLDADFFPGGHSFSGRQAIAHRDRWLTTP